MLTSGALSCLSAQTAITWTGSTGNWSNGILWSTGGVPNGGGYDVFIDGGKTGTASAVTMDGNYTVGRLTVDAGDTLNLADSHTLTVSNGAFAGSGALVNNGAVGLNDAGNGSSLVFNGAGTISGTGAIVLSGANSRIFASHAGDRITIGSGQTILGAGNLGGGTTTITNAGSVAATVNGGTLTLQPGGGTADFTNNGTLSAGNGGTLAFSNASGGTLTNNGTISVGTASAVTIPAGALTNLSGTTLTGGFYNLSATGPGTTTLSLGGGQIITNNAFIDLYGASTVFNELNSLANNQGSLTIEAYRNFTTAGALTNSGGLNVFGTEAPVNTYDTTLTISGAWNNSGNAAADAGGRIVVQGNVTNTGAMVASDTGRISVSGTLTNGGTLVSGAASQAASKSAGVISVSGALIQTSTGSLVGDGTVSAPTMSLAGTVRARYGTESYGRMTLVGQVSFLGSTKLVFDLGTTAASDQIQVNGALTLDGTLTVNALTGFGAGRYDLINYTGALTDNGLDLGTLPVGYYYAVDTSRAGEVDLIVSTTAIVPEPSTWAAVLAGGGFLALVLRRRVRR